MIGSVTLLIPWERNPRSASLGLVPPALGLIATANAYGGFPFFGFGVCFVVVFVWLGVSHRPLVSLAFAPLTAIAYLAPVIATHTAVGAGAARRAMPTTTTATSPPRR